MIAYIIHTYIVCKDIKEYINDQLLVDCNKETKHLFAHILCGHEINLWKNSGWTPISNELLKKKLRNSRWSELYSLGVIEVSSHNKQRRLSKEFRITPSLFNTIQSMRAITYKSILAPDKYNLCNSKKVTKAKTFQKTKYYDSSRNKIFTEWQEKAVKNIEVCKINRKEVEHLLLGQQVFIDNNVVTNNEILSFNHNLRCWEGVVLRALKEEGDFIYYQSSWEPQNSGRLTELGGGLLNASRELKEAMIKNTGYINLDLKGSQVYGAKCELDLHGIDTSWFDYYQKIGKHGMANKLGISVDAWKGMLCSILMGGFPELDRKGQVKTKHFDILINNSKCTRKFICPEVGLEIEWNPVNRTYYLLYIHNSTSKGTDEIQNMFQILNDIAKECLPLIKGIKEWHKLLFNKYVSDTGNNKARFICRNKCDGKLDVTKYVNKLKTGYSLNPKGQRKVAAHILQGKESAFIHYLTAFSGEDYKVVSNQYDGIVIQGEIPLELVINAREFSGLPFAELEEKAIA